MPSARKSSSRRRALPVLRVVVPPLPRPLTRIMSAPAWRILMAGKSQPISRASASSRVFLNFSIQDRLSLKGWNSRPASRTVTWNLPWSSLAHMAPPAPLPITTALFIFPVRPFDAGAAGLGAFAQAL